MANHDNDRPWGKPIFRWAGSKRRLLPTLMSSMPEKYARYIEPFAGSSCLFFAARPASAILGDINVELIDAYATIQKHPRIVSRLAHALPNTPNHYYAVRRLSPMNLSAVARAARFLYLNRYCFNGVYRTNREGAFNVPRGMSTGEIPREEDVYRASVALRRAAMVASDFDGTLRRARRGDFAYLDPPYATGKRPRYGEYGYGSFAEVDIVRLLDALEDLDTRGVMFLMSYADRRSLRQATRKWHQRQLLVRRHVAGFTRHRVRVREILISNYV